MKHRRAGLNARPRVFKRGVFSQLLYMKAQLLKLNSQVDGYIGDIFGKIQHHGSEIEDPTDTGRDKRVGHLLRSFCRDSQDP